jgi:hypothetical protein
LFFYYYFLNNFPFLIREIRWITSSCHS